MQFSKILLIGLLGLFAVACGKQEMGTADDTAVTVSMGEVEVSDLELVPAKGIWLCQGQPFTGIALEKDSVGQVLTRTEFVSGKRHGLLRHWFADGRLKYEAGYLHNRLEGEVRAWWENGNLQSEKHYENGVLQGDQKQWYKSGKLFKHRIMVDGREEGLQRAWRENGKLYCNYEARNGRIFGLKRANLCFEVDDEKVVLQD